MPRHWHNMCYILERECLRRRAFTAGTMRGMTMSGVILFEGPSQLDGKPIVAIATIGSHNVKTGAMVQTWILRADVEPHTACKTGDDRSICGDCPHRPANGGACYVTVFQAPLSVYRAYKRGRYPKAGMGTIRATGAGRNVRLGSYGDPAAVPRAVWDALVSGALSHTGYTHQWRMADLQTLCMASIDAPDELADAKARGYRTFRVRRADEPLLQGEAVCPASAEGGNKLQCADCGACAGANGRRGTIAIVVHGARGKVNAFNNQREC